MEEVFHQESSNLRIKRKHENISESNRSRIIQSTGKKDRHSKIFTSKGPRDRRVRLSAHTAVRFYDVQDRLGCDRPSKAIDWLIREAKSAIDALDEMPSRNFSYSTMASMQPNINPPHRFQIQNQMDENVVNNSFRVSSDYVNLGSYTHGVISRNRQETVETKHCFQPFQNDISNITQSAVPSDDFSLAPDMGWFNKMLTLNNFSSISRNCKEPDGCIDFSQNQEYSERESLQSSYSPSIPEFSPLFLTGDVFGSNELAGYSASSQFEEHQSEHNSFIS